jgi:DNA transposition AAA+ family ATPase
MAESALKKDMHSQQAPRIQQEYHPNTWPANHPSWDLSFVETSIYKKNSGVYSHCYETPDMGLIIESSGLGKTKTAREYKEQHFNTTSLISCSIMTRSIGAVLSRLTFEVHCGGGSSNYFVADQLIRNLSETPRLLIFDDAHFLKWEILEFIRNIHDHSGCGVVFLGQEVLYDKMLGSKKSYIWDQLTSRVGIHLRIESPTRDDVELICRKIFPDLDAKSLEYLASRATGPGKFRAAVKLLEKAIQAHTRKGMPLDVKLLKDIDELLSFKGGWL